MGHDHGTADSHVHAAANTRRLGIAIAIIAAVLIAELVGSAISGSLSLLADAGHMSTDLVGLIVALVAVRLAARPASDTHTWGRRRVEVLAALANGILLAALVIFVAVEAITRLVSGGGNVAATPMLTVAALGAIANVIALVLLRGGSGDSINMRAAYLEVLGDLIGSIAVIVAAIIILTTGFTPADPIASLAVSALIAPRAFKLLREAIGVLAERTPHGTNVSLIREHVLRTIGVVDVHDVHVWAITPGSTVFSAHVVVEPEVFTSGRSTALLDELGACLADHFDVEHSTFQLEEAGRAGTETQQHR